MEYTQLKEVVQKAVDFAMANETRINTLEDGSQVKVPYSADLSKIADVGKDVEAAGQLDAFFRSLIDQAGAIVDETKRYTADLPNIHKTSWEYGAYLEVSEVAPADYEINNSVKLENGKQYPAHTYYGSDISVKIFNGRKTIEVRKSISEEYDEIRQAFQTWEQMNNLISGIMTSFENAFELAYEQIANMLIQSAIVISKTATNTSINLREMYNEAHGTALTPNECMSNPDFLRYATQMISLTRSRMTKYGYFFNNKNIPTFTKKDEQELLLLDLFSSGVETYLYSTTYNDEYVKLGKYKSTPFWQSPVGQNESNLNEVNCDFDVVSSFNYSDANNELGGGAVPNGSIKNVIGLLYDIRGIGATNERRKTNSEFTPSSDFRTYYGKAYANYYVNPNKNIVAFTVD